MSLYFITTITNSAIHWTENDRGDVRCVGFVNDLDTAIEIIETNSYDIYENMYRYCVIERIDKPGVYPDVEEEIWFEFNQSDNGYVKIEKPIETKYLINWCLG